MLIFLNLSNISSEIASIINIIWLSDEVNINQRSNAALIVVFVIPIIINYIELALNLNIWIRYYFVIKDKVLMK